MGLTCTHTYAILEVDSSSYADVRRRLIGDRPPEVRRDYEREYLGEYEGREIIVLGSIALLAEDAK